MKGLAVMLIGEQDELAHVQRSVFKVRLSEPATVMDALSACKAGATRRANRTPLKMEGSSKLAERHRQPMLLLRVPSLNVAMHKAPDICTSCDWMLEPERVRYSRPTVQCVLSKPRRRLLQRMNCRPGCCPEKSRQGDDKRLFVKT